MTIMLEHMVPTPIQQMYSTLRLMHLLQYRKETLWILMRLHLM